MLDKFGKFSLSYHELFDYPLTEKELIKWTPGRLPKGYKYDKKVIFENGYWFFERKTSLVSKLLKRYQNSDKKIKIARRASRALSCLPMVKLIAVTGSLAMRNTSENGDIDLLIITENGQLWTTRLIVYLILKIFGFSLRHPGNHAQKDKLCLNMWMDENDLVWKSPRNFYTAHEIAQIVPLLNKNNMYEKFLFQNKWILDFWPNSVRIVNYKLKNSQVRTGLIEQIAYKIQLNHMRSKITREIVTPTRAVFHPKDWSEEVAAKFSP